METCDICGKRIGAMEPRRAQFRDKETGRVWDFCCDCFPTAHNLFLKQISDEKLNEEIREFLTQIDRYGGEK